MRYDFSGGTLTKHYGPVCRECKCDFYYDYLEEPQRYESSGLCWECWVHQQRNNKMAATQELGMPEIIVTMHDVTVCGTRIRRPVAIAPSQWLWFWNEKTEPAKVRKQGEWK